MLLLFLCPCGLGVLDGLGHFGSCSRNGIGIIFDELDIRGEAALARRRSTHGFVGSQRHAGNECERHGDADERLHEFVIRFCHGLPRCSNRRRTRRVFARPQ